MSLLPRIPCRKLFIDSRYALRGSSTHFEVEIPEGGLDLPDNCVGIIDHISVPSFPNVFHGRHRLYYRKPTSSDVHYKYVELTPDNLSLAEFASELLTAIAQNTPIINRNTFNITTDMTFELQGTDTSESFRVLTDHELSSLTDISPAWDLAGTYDIEKYIF